MMSITRRRPLRRGHRALGPRGRDDQDRQREQEQQRRQVAPPSRSLRDHVGHQRGIGERGRVAPAPALHGAVRQRGHRDEHEAGEQDGRLGEADRERRHGAASSAARGAAPAATAGATAPSRGESRARGADGRRDRAASRPTWRARGGRRPRAAEPRRPPRARPAAASAKRRRTRRRLVFDVHLPARLGVDEPEVADRWQLELARVADLDREHAVAPAQRAQRLLPVARRRGSPRPRRAARAGAPSTRSGATPPRARSRPRRRTRARARSSPSSPSRPSRPWRGRSAWPVLAPAVTTPSRLPRRVATWPIASATPSATSALRRSAVPNVIEAETSSSSHAVRARSPTCTRTCGSRMRAVTFQSMWRTSSPG